MAYKFNPFYANLDEYGPILTGTGTVSAAADGTAALPGIAFTNDLNTGIYRPGADQLALSTGGTGRLFIRNDGTVVVAKAVNSFFSVSDTDSNDRLQLAYMGTPDGTTLGHRIAGTGVDLHYYTRLGQAGSHIFSTNNAGVAAERARIDSSGRLLVGTSSWSGSNLLTIQGNTNTATGGGELFLARGASAPDINSGDLISRLSFGDKDDKDYATIQCQADGNPGVNNYPARLVFFTNPGSPATSPTERMWIRQDGRTSCFSSGQGITSVISAAAGTTVQALVCGHSATSIQSGTLSFRVWSNGNVENTNNSYGAISDIKLKENIVDANSQWSDIKALQVRNYNLKEGQTHTQIGLIAQEVEPISPGLVYESPDRDEDGNDLGTVTKSVNYSVLYMKAVKALQEAMERIETLEAKVAALESA